MYYAHKKQKVNFKWEEFLCRIEVKYRNSDLHVEKRRCITSIRHKN